LQVRNNKNTSNKCQKFEKVQVRRDDNIFKKHFWQKCLNFEVSRLGLGVFDEVSISVSSRNFHQVSVSKVLVSTTSLTHCFQFPSLPTTLVSRPITRGRRRAKTPEKFLPLLERCVGHQ